MVLGVLENGFFLTRIGREIRILRADSIPMVTIEDGVVICWRHIVAKDFTALVNTVDVPSLRVVSAHAIIIEEGLPLGEVVIGEVK